MAKGTCGGRDFTVVTMGIHGEKKRKCKCKRKMERRGEGEMRGTQAAGNEKEGRRKEKQEIECVGCCGLN
jgi:hypothetical protein